MGWLRLVGSLRLYVSFAKRALLKRLILQKKQNKQLICPNFFLKIAEHNQWYHQVVAFSTSKAHTIPNVWALLFLLFLKRLESRVFIEN